MKTHQCDVCLTTRPKHELGKAIYPLGKYFFTVWYCPDNLACEEAALEGVQTDARLVV